MSSFYVSLDDLETVRGQINQLQAQDLDPTSSTAPLSAQQFHIQTASSMSRQDAAAYNRQTVSEHGSVFLSNFGPFAGLPEAAATDHAHGQAQAAIWALIQQCVTANGNLGDGLNATHTAYAQVEADLGVHITNVANGT
ncbi:MAG TPA: hypothetical protein VGX23_12380 [Actinocrinis sp.]|nr:hypothetical protein [Actinocrinis sp.]